MKILAFCRALWYNIYMENKEMQTRNTEEMVTISRAEYERLQQENAQMEATRVRLEAERIKLEAEHARLEAKLAAREQEQAQVITSLWVPTPICAENAPPAWAAVVDFRSAERQLEQYCAWLRRFSKCFGAECIDFRADFFDPNGRLKRELLLDGLHPTPEGHQIMARRLCAHLKRERQG